VLFLAMISDAIVIREGGCEQSLSPPSLKTSLLTKQFPLKTTSVMRFALKIVLRGRNTHNFSKKQNIFPIVEIQTFAKRKSTKFRNHTKNQTVNAKSE